MAFFPFSSTKIYIFPQKPMRSMAFFFVKGTKTRSLTFLDGGAMLTLLIFYAFASPNVRMARMCTKTLYIK